MPETPQPSKADPELDALKRLKDIEEAKTALQKARAGRVASAFGESDIKPPEGKTTAEKAELLGKLLAYEQLTQVAYVVADDISPIADKGVVIYSEKEAAAALNYPEVVSQLKDLRDRLVAVLNVSVDSTDGTITVSPNRMNGDKQGQFGLLPLAPVLAALPMALSGIAAGTQAVVGLLAWFRRDTKVTGFDVALDEVAFVAALADHLDAPVTYGALITPQKGPANELEEVLATIRELKRYAAGSPRPPAQDKSQEGADATKKSEASALASIVEHCDELETTLLTPDATTGLTALSRLSRAERILRQVHEDGQHLLYVKVNLGGGETIIESNAIGSDKLQHAGGVVVTYILVDSAGTIRKSRVLSAFSGALDREDIGDVLRSTHIAVDASHD